MSVLIGTGDRRRMRLITLGVGVLGLAAVMALIALSGLSPLRADDPGEGPLGGALAHEGLLGLDEEDSAALEDFRRDTGGSSLAGSLRPAETVDLYTYSAKVVCVPNLGKAGGAVVPGAYKTAVNVHNPGSEPALSPNPPKDGV